MPEVIMYSTPYCPFCLRAKHLLDSKKVKYRDIRVDINPRVREQMIKSSGGRYTVPQIWVGEQHIGGYDDMWALNQRGVLDRLLDDETVE